MFYQIPITSNLNRPAWNPQGLRHLGVAYLIGCHLGNVLQENKYTSQWYIQPSNKISQMQIALMMKLIATTDNT